MKHKTIKKRMHSLHRTAKSGGGPKGKKNTSERRTPSPKPPARSAPKPPARPAPKPPARSAPKPIRNVPSAALAPVSVAPVAEPAPSRLRIPLNPHAFVFEPDFRPRNEPEPPVPIDLSRNTTTATVLFFSNIMEPVAIDCEMVGVGPIRNDGTTESALAQVSIVDVNGTIIYNSYVIPPGGKNSITNYRTRYSGITEKIINSLNTAKHSYEIVKEEVFKRLQNKIIVGHHLSNDFAVLDYNPLANNNIIWDTAEIDEFKQTHSRYGRVPRKLKDLAAEIGNNIQLEPNDLNDPKGHSPVEDARASMNLYRRYVLNLPRIQYKNMKK
jgi:hypothetical protein